MPQNRGVVAVIIKNYGNYGQYGANLYRTCVSLNRDKTICLGTDKDEESASARLSSFWQAYDEGTIRGTDDLLRLVDQSEALDQIAQQSARHICSD
jgi:hypothetical protein